MGLEYDDDTDGDGMLPQDGLPNVPSPLTAAPMRFNNALYPPSPLPTPDGLTLFKKYTAPHPCRLTPLPLRECWKMRVPVRHLLSSKLECRPNELARGHFGGASKYSVAINSFVYFIS